MQWTLWIVCPRLVTVLAHSFVTQVGVWEKTLAGVWKNTRAGTPDHPVTPFEVVVPVHVNVQELRLSLARANTLMQQRSCAAGGYR